MSFREAKEPVMLDSIAERACSGLHDCVYLDECSFAIDAIPVPLLIPTQRFQCSVVTYGYKAGIV